jgi:hypothetical protein
VRLSRSAEVVWLAVLGDLGEKPERSRPRLVPRLLACSGSGRVRAGWAGGNFGHRGTEKSDRVSDARELQQHGAPMPEALTPRLVDLGCERADSSRYGAAIDLEPIHLQPLTVYRNDTRRLRADEEGT